MTGKYWHHQPTPSAQDLLQLANFQDRLRCDPICFAHTTTPPSPPPTGKSGSSVISR